MCSRRVDCGVRELPGTEANRYVECPREELVEGCRLGAAVVVTGDGAFLQTAAGTHGVAEHNADFSSSVSKTNMGKFLRIAPRAPGESNGALFEPQNNFDATARGNSLGPDRHAMVANVEARRFRFTVPMVKSYREHRVNSRSFTSFSKAATTR
mgnify:CR=1 FL=1